MLEEFLISGCAIQRIGMRRPSSQPIIDNISPSDFFVNPHRDPRGNDIEQIGEAHTHTHQEKIWLEVCSTGVTRYAHARSPAYTKT